MFDGLPDDVFTRLLDGGSLPTIKAALVDRGLRVENAVTSVPSETYPNLAGMLTGLFPGHHGIPANVWLDRRLRRREAHTNIFRAYATGEFLAPEARNEDRFQFVPAAPTLVWLGGVAYAGFENQVG